MNRRPCLRTEALLAALARGPLAPAEQSHLATCAACTDAVVVREAMTALAATLVRRAALPPAQVALLRARLESRRRLAERSLRPLEIWRGVTAALAAAGLVAGLRLSSGFFAGLTAARATPSDPAALLLTCGIVALFALPLLGRPRTFVG
jgi:hypothetical protein